MATRSLRNRISLALVALLVLPLLARGEDRAAPEIGHAPAVAAAQGMVVAQEALAARIGVDILQKGGNAVDAAVAVGFAMAVTYPRAGNLGGGGFMVIHRAGGEDTTIDYRETAPQAINAKSFLDAEGNADPQKSRDSALAIGVPGTVAGLALAAEKYGSGRFTLADLIAPAIALAREGIAITDDTADSLPRDRSRLARWPSSAEIFLKPDGTAFGPGERLVQADLANTLEAIAKAGPRAFYAGPIAEKIASAVQAAGGVMTADDLKDYRAVERAPVRGTYRGYDVVSMPPPSSGGVVLVEMLNILEGYDLAHEGEAQSLFLMTEAMKRAYADRAWFLGDPDVVHVPLARLTAKSHAAEWRATIDPAHATPAARDSPARRRAGGGREHDPFLRGGQFRQRGREHLHAQLQLRRRPRRRRDRRPAQQRARRFRRQAGRAERLWPARLPGERPRTGKAAAVVDDADDRAQGRQAVPRHRFAGRQPHHQRGAAGRRRRDRPRHGYRQPPSRRRACTISGCPT